MIFSLPKLFQILTIQLNSCSLSLSLRTKPEGKKLLRQESNTEKSPQKSNCKTIKP